MSLSKRCSSDSLHFRTLRFELIPMRLTNLQQAQRGFPDSFTRLVTRALNSALLVSLFVRTSSRAAFDQRNSRRGFPSCTSPLLLASPGSWPVDLEESLTESGSEEVSAADWRELSGSWSSTFIVGPNYFYTNNNVRCVALSEYTQQKARTYRMIIPCPAKGGDGRFRGA